MRYIEDAVHEIETAVVNGAYAHITETDVIDELGELEARKLVERWYCDDRQYSGPLHTVANEVHDGWRVMVMEVHDE